MTDYEWGVWSNIENVIHRENMTEKQARTWVRTWDEEVKGDVFQQDMFSVCKRPRGDWQVEH